MKEILAVLVGSWLIALGWGGGSRALTQPALRVLQDSPAENIAFRWGFGALVGKDKKFVTIGRDTALGSGDELKMVVELRKNCYVYVIHHSPKGEVALLFPESFGQFAGDYAVGKNYYVPKGRGWFELDNSTGRETFYLLSSTERLLDLEALVGNYSSAKTEQKSDLGKKIVAEIRDVKRKFRNFATLAERPVTIGGNVRGVEGADPANRPDVASIVTEISANNFYAKTFTIEHK
ncbi:MAG TPA: DUF4384 domain-containing protein [Bacteroidota bacterium]